MDRVKIISDGTSENTTVMIGDHDISHLVHAISWELRAVDRIAHVELEFVVAEASFLDDSRIQIIGLDTIPTEILEAELEGRDDVSRPRG